ncbi:MAG TPA: PepSY domain-containing protein, partial [Caulobacteraceae bacterium]|nr:PepSY domain-containing protein [Caulobacteraceae bacterium]
PKPALPPNAYADLDHVAPTVAGLHLDYPVLVTPPAKPGGAWGARSDTQTRPRRVTLTLDGASGAVLTRQNFNQRNWVDQAVGYGVAGHEGQLFGWPNTLLSLFTAMGLATSCLSALVLWLRRRSSGVLGAPAPAAAPRFSAGLLAIVAVLGVLLPLFGGSVVIVALAERLLLRRIPRLNTWLGLRPLVTAIVAPLG